MSSIITVLKKVYKEGLEPKGFVQLKGRHPYFVRVIGGEIVQVITFRKEPGPVCVEERDGNYYHPVLGHFAIYGGIATVYRKKIDLSIAPRDNFDWLLSQDVMYKYRFDYNSIDDCSDLKYSFNYLIDDYDSMYSAAKESLSMTNKVFISLFDEVDDLEKCIKYLEDYTTCMRLSDKKAYGWDDVRFGTDFKTEGLLYIKTQNNDDFIKRFKRSCEIRFEKFSNADAKYTEEEHNKYCKEIEKYRQEQIRIRDRILNTPDIYMNAMKELDKRKNDNIETLRSYGIDI